MLKIYEIIIKIAFYKSLYYLCEETAAKSLLKHSIFSASIIQRKRIDYGKDNHRKNIY